MNQKAIKQQIEFPPLINLQEDQPAVHNDFRSVERINAPYLNGMLTPLWHSEYEYTNKPVWDFENNRYEIIDGWLTKNGENLFPVNNEHFKKEDVTSLYQDYLAFDFDSDGNLAKLEWDTGTNTVSLTYDDVTISQQLFVNGVILTSRVRCINNTAIGVVIYEVNNSVFMAYLNTAKNRKVVKTVTWCTTTPKTASNTNTFVNTAITIKNPNPVINIANPLSNVYAVSLVSNYGQVLYTRKEGYYTFVDNNGTYIDGTSWAALGGSSTETIRNYEITNFIFSSKFTNYSSAFDVHNRDGTWYYNNDPTTEVPNSDDNTFNPKIIPGFFFTYEGNNYQSYRATLYTNTFTFDSSVDDLHGNSALLIVATDDDFSLTGNYVDNKVQLTRTWETWVNRAVSPSTVFVTYNNTDYNVPDFRKTYTITEELAPTTISANYITAPQVFLDNGNLYSWYTIPQAASTSGSQPITFPASTLLVESGSLNTISGSNYTFDTIEAHLVNSFTVNGRSNSICVDQNFWNSSNKMSVGIRAPYDIYVAKTGSDTYSANVKYTEYSNSNCTDMLYYAGTIPYNEYLFFPIEDVQKKVVQDVAWFNPGGFRAPLKGNWNILYYVDPNGSVFVQGLSYSEDSNKMGTLITPLASISDIAYITASNNFIVYCDKDNRYWKISIEEGGELSSIFDNHYIIVNTTSYWNMWDCEKNMKFHYATDYNNRTKFGFTRTEYRASASTYFTSPEGRRQWATAINPNYDILPRLPVSSIMPAALSLGLTLDDITPYLRAYSSSADEAREVQAIDCYWQGTNKTDTSCKYIASIKVFANGNQIYRNSSLLITAWGTGTSIIYIADIFSKFINGAGNNDFIIENNAKYPLIYNLQSKPTFMYSSVNGIENEGTKWFFVIQGQYYAVIGEKLYAMIYNKGYISQSDAIVDIRDMKYVGNTPAIAFFVNPYTKQIYSFTGDANLQQIFDASKFSFELVNDEITHWYDESTQSIYIKTDKGLLVFGPQNTYLLEDFKDTTDIEFTKGDIHIVGSKVDTLRYYHDIDTYEDLPIEIETSFYGIGNNESTSIDRWNITLYDTEHREQDVELQVRSLTDVSTQSETKKLHINANDWDKWSHSILLSYSPKLIKGQGIRLSVKSHSAIQKIVPHIMDNSTGTTTKGKFEI
jgi:hypothetical protein